MPILRELEGKACPDCGSKTWHGRAAGEKLPDGSHGGEQTGFAPEWLSRAGDGKYYLGVDAWQCSHCGCLADVDWMGWTVTGERILKGKREREERPRSQRT